MQSGFATVVVALLLGVGCGPEEVGGRDAGLAPEGPGPDAAARDAGGAADAGGDDAGTGIDAARPDARACHAYESCGNAVDDDCDGETDEGCIVDVVLSDRTDGTQYGGTGGTAFGRVCYTGQVAHGLHGAAGEYVDRIGLMCANLWIVVADGSRGREYKVAVDHTVDGVLVGGEGGTSFELACPEGQVLGGIFGAAGDVLTGIGVQCMWPVVTELSDGSLRLSLEEGTRLGPEGGSAGSSFEYDCGSGRIATGMRSRAGLYVDRFGLICERAAPDE